MTALELRDFASLRAPTGRTGAMPAGGRRSEATPSRPSAGTPGNARYHIGYHIRDPPFVNRSALMDEKDARDGAALRTLPAIVRTAGQLPDSRLRDPDARIVDNRACGN